jgi:hypothetical protein
MLETRTPAPVGIVAVMYARIPCVTVSRVSRTTPLGWRMVKTRRAPPDPNWNARPVVVAGCTAYEWSRASEVAKWSTL